MPKEKQSPEWLIYERCVAAFASEEFSSLETTVQPNVRLKGELSGTMRQIDVLIDGRWEQGSKTRIIVDAKLRDRPLDVEAVEAFEGMMKDCRASRGILVCTAGWSAAAKRRAQDAITITLLDFEEAVEGYGLAYGECLGPCAEMKKVGDKRRPKVRGGVLWGEYVLQGYGPYWVIAQVGKCDGCHSFHVWCWDCGTRFAVPDQKAGRRGVRVVECSCEARLWASVRESAETGHQGKPESIWLMMRIAGCEDAPVAFDRRPIR